MIRTLIIDDEQHAVNRLCHLLGHRCSALVTLAGTAFNVEDGMEAIDRLAPDLVFLDIHLQDQTGFDLLRRIGRQHTKFDLIFTTAYNQYAVQAFKFSAIDYLLKPVDPDDLEQAVNKVAQKKEKAAMDARFEALLYNVRALQTATKRLCIPVMNGLEFVQVSDIMRCESEINYTHLYLTDLRKLLVPKTLKEFEDLLSPYDFYRVHNSHLVNLRFIKGYKKGKGGYITMKDNTTIEVSTRRRDDFLKRLADM